MTITANNEESDMSISALEGISLVSQITEGMKALTPRDIDRLTDVHPKLIQVIFLARHLTDTPFMVVEGVRTKELQEQYVKEGKSRTMNSKHLKQPDGYGHAVDLCGTEKKTSFEWSTLKKVAAAMETAAEKLSIKIKWGGSWTSFPDAPHFQLEI